jgi:cobalamin biosynthesis Mg chelatase CobN
MRLQTAMAAIALVAALGVAGPLERNLAAMTMQQSGSTPSTTASEPAQTAPSDQTGQTTEPQSAAPQSSSSPQTSTSPQPGTTRSTQTADQERTVGSADRQQADQPVTRTGELPRTASPLWAIGITGLGFLGLGMGVLRRKAR